MNPTTSKLPTLLTGGALATFAFTLVTFVSTVTPLHAINCWDVGFAVGQNCLEEVGAENCASCAYPLCGMYAFPPGYPPDYQCALTCGAGAESAGCWAP